VLIANGRAALGDVVVVTAGAPPGIEGSTNNVHVHRVGDSEVILAAQGDTVAQAGNTASR
jgi:hypothetical protein